MVNDTHGLLLDKLVVISGLSGGGEGGGGTEFGSVFPVTFVSYFLYGEMDRKIWMLFFFSFSVFNSKSRMRLEANFEKFPSTRISILKFTDSG